MRLELLPPWFKPDDRLSCRLGASQSDSASASARNGGRPPHRARGDEPPPADDKHGLTLASGLPSAVSGLGTSPAQQL